MTLNEGHSIDSGPATGDLQPTDRPAAGSRPDPEEGHRLMRAFIGIRKPMLREVILRLVAEMAKSDAGARDAANCGE